MKIPFTKMEGCGNDYVYVNGFEVEVPDPAGLSRSVSDRHVGIGSDGLILICPSKVADARMAMYNADGSEGAMCGNGIRCVGKYLYDHHMVNRPSINIETKSGIKHLEMEIEEGEAVAATVDMGKAVSRASRLPVLLDDPVTDVPFTLADRTFEFTMVSMGNPHAVTFLKDSVDDFDLAKYGPLMEHHRLFPEGTNTEFVNLYGRREARMRVWERGSGETMACGTGACAVAYAGCLKGLMDYDQPISVHVLGGTLTITCHRDGSVHMTGPCHTSFSGVYDDGD